MDLRISSIYSVIAFVLPGRVYIIVLPCKPAADLLNSALGFTIPYFTPYREEIYDPEYCIAQLIAS